MEIFDNITKVVRDDLKEKIKPGSRVSVVAACFSMYAYKELKSQLEKVEEFRFIFASPTFIKESAEKQKRKFYIPRLSRENSLYGTEFEIKLRNEMTQKAIARECAEWIRKKAKFKSNVTGEYMGGFMTVASDAVQTAYLPINGFTTVDIGCERLNYDVLFHTDLSRTGGVSNGLDLDRLNWGNYDLVVSRFVPCSAIAVLMGVRQKLMLVKSLKCWRRIPG